MANITGTTSQRIRIGLTGLAFAFLLVLIGSTFAIVPETKPLDDLLADLQRQREEIDKQSKVLPKEAIAKRLDDWQKQMMELQGIFLEYNKELEREQKKLTEPVFEKMLGIITPATAYT